MPRREELKISLFPFMSILACTIGALTFLLVTMAMTSVGATRLVSDEEKRRAAELADRLPQIEASLERLERDWEELERAETLLEQLDAALEERGLAAGESLAGVEAMLIEAGRAADLEAKLGRLKRAIARAATERGQIETSISVLESRRETLPILIDPTGLSRNQKPYFVECEEGGATAYRVSDDLEYFVPVTDLNSSGDFGRYLRRVRALPGALLVLLVRENGIETAKRVESLARASSIRVARLPMPGDGRIDFRLLRRAEGAKREG
jgi:HPt (histidine-containing phosphotransfer) domain-containing protein